MTKCTQKQFKKEMAQPVMFDFDRTGSRHI